MESDTIAAIATPAGSGGIGIIKISGTSATAIAKRIFKHKKNGPLPPLGGDTILASESHRLSYGHIYDPESGKTLDEVLLARMAARQSYTREDVVEINTHGGPAVVRAILELVLRSGARLAEPGEFTKRAYLNGRIDLTQAEAIVDIIQARSRKALEIAALQLEGGLREQIEAIHRKLMGVLVEVEAGIDFPEEVDLETTAENIKERLKDIITGEIDALIQEYEDGRVYREGIRLVVLGKPNVGKSSIVNRLLETDRVIVTEVPGTTRDIVEENLVLHGIPVVISDTAGLRQTTDPIEILGIRKTEAAIEQADVLLFVFDAASPATEEDRLIYQRLQDKETVLVYNKIDLVSEGEEICRVEEWEGLPSAEVSALRSSGIRELRSLLTSICGKGGDKTDDDRLVPNLRQAQALEEARRAVEAAISAVASGLPPELVAIDLKEGIQQLDGILGNSVGEGVLAQIFDRFCIGK